MPQVACPKCGRKLNVPDASTALKVRCPACQHIFEVAVGLPIACPAPVAALASSSGMKAPKRPTNTPAVVACCTGLTSLIPCIGLVLAPVAAITGLIGVQHATKYPEAKGKGLALTGIIVGGLSGLAHIALIVALGMGILDSRGPTAGATPAAPPLRFVHDTPPAAPNGARALPPDLVLEPTPPPAARPMSPEELFAKASPAVVRVVARDKGFKAIGLGSGFFVRKEGLLVTNHHVIQDAHFASVLLSNNTTLFVSGIVAVDAKHDLALLRVVTVNAGDLPALGVAAGPPPNVGTRVYAIGNPKGMTNTLSDGIVSALRVIPDGNPLTQFDPPDLIQTTAAISHGSSGGPLLTVDGQVVGVTTSFLADGQNLNFAVAASRVRALIDAIGPAKPLASAGGTPLDKDGTTDLDKVWEAIEREDWRTALSLLTKLRPVFGNSPFYWYIVALVHSMMGSYDLAVDALKAALAINPDYADALVGLGGAYGALGDGAKAIAAFTAALAIKPDYAAAHSGLGLVYEQQGKYAEAIAAYRRAAQLDPNGEVGRMARDAIQRLSNPPRR